MKENEILPGKTECISRIKFIERYSLENLPHTASIITFLQNTLILIQSNQIVGYNTLNNKLLVTHYYSRHT